jgi:hypothetical protein
MSRVVYRERVFVFNIIVPMSRDLNTEGTGVKVGDARSLTTFT